MNSEQTKQEREAARAEGYAAAERREHFNTHCPYLFFRAGVGQDEFNDNWRHKMDGWFDGWRACLDEQGLGNDFKPKGEGKRHPRRAAMKDKGHDN